MHGIVTGLVISIDRAEEIPPVDQSQGMQYLVHWMFPDFTIWFSKKQLPELARIFTEAAAEYPAVDVPQ